MSMLESRDEVQRNVCKMLKVLSSLPKWYPQTSIHDKTSTCICLENDNSKNSQLIIKKAFSWKNVNTSVRKLL